MKRLVIRGGMVITPTEERLADIWVEQDKIIGVGDLQKPAPQTGAGESDKNEDQIEIDASGCFVTPALFDIQVNGGPECDFWSELTKSKVSAFSERLLAHGVGTILPTLITGDLDQLQKNRDYLREHIGLSLSRQFAGSGAIVRMPGIHYEGPCISPEKPGVHPTKFLQPLSLDVLKKLIDETTSLVTVAPELDPSGEALKFIAEKNALAALGHSNATYEEAGEAFKRGIKLMTHTFNALPPIHHRKPGAVTAALLDKNVTCCVICDGLHVDPALVEVILKIKGSDKTILVSDVASVGTSQGGLVGSSILLDEAVRNVVKWGLATFREAIAMASYNPSRLFGLQKEIGVIAPGAFADILLWNRKDLSLKQVVFNGCPISSRGRSSVLSV